MAKVQPALWREKVPALYGFFVAKYGPLWCQPGVCFEPDQQDRQAMRKLLARAAAKLPAEKRG